MGKTSKNTPKLDPETDASLRAMRQIAPAHRMGGLVVIICKDARHASKLRHLMYEKVFGPEEVATSSSGTQQLRTQEGTLYLFRGSTPDAWDGMAKLRGAAFYADPGLAEGEIPPEMRAEVRRVRV